MQVATETKVLQVGPVDYLPTWAPNEQAFAVDCLLEERRKETRVYDVHGNILWKAPEAMQAQGSSCISWAPNSRLLVCECRARPLTHVYTAVNLSDGSIAGSTSALAWGGFSARIVSPDGSMFAYCASPMGGRQATVTVYSTRTGSELWHNNGWQAWWHPSNQFLTIWDDAGKTVCTHAVLSGAVVASYSFLEAAGKISLSWDPSGRRMVLATYAPDGHDSMTCVTRVCDYGACTAAVAGPSGASSEGKQAPKSKSSKVAKKQRQRKRR